MKVIPVKSILQKRLSLFYNYLLPFWTLYVIFPSYLEIQPAFDTSWMLGNLAQINLGYIFGKEALFLNYGPLGFLSHRIEATVFYHPWVFLWDIGYTFLAYYYLKKRGISHLNSERLNAWFILLIAYCISFSYNSIGFVYLFISIFLIDEKRLDLQGLGWSLIWFLPLIKTNFLPAALAISAIFLIRFAFEKKGKGILLMLSCSTAVVLLAWPALKVDLLGFLKGVYEISSGYAMSFEKALEGWKGLMFWLLSVLSLIALCFSILQLGPISIVKEKSYAAISSAFVALVFASLLYKSAFIRADLEHNTLYFCYAPLPFLILRNNSKPSSKYILLGVGLLCFLLVGAPKIGVNNVKAERIIASLHSVWELPMAKPSKSENAVEPELIKIIGSKSVDIQPVHGYAAYELSLNYKPSNLIQAVYGYTPYLDSLSANWFSSKSRPHYLLLNADDLDTLPPTALFSEFYTTIKQNYTLEKETNNWLLFKETDTYKTPEYLRKGLCKIPTNQFIDIPIPLKGEVLLKWKGNNKSLLNWLKPSEPIRLKVNTLVTNKNYRITQALLKKGFLLSAFNKEVSALKEFMNSSENSQAQSIAIEGAALPDTLEFEVYQIQ